MPSPSDRRTPARTTARIAGIIPVCLADRYAGVRIVLRERLGAAGGAQVVAEAGSVADVRDALRGLPDEVVVVAGLAFPDGTATALLGGRHRVIVYSWLPPDEREVALDAATAVVGPPLVPGIVAALRALPVAYPERTRHADPHERSPR